MIKTQRLIVTSLDIVINTNCYINDSNFSWVVIIVVSLAALIGGGTTDNCNNTTGCTDNSVSGYSDRLAGDNSDR